MEILTNILHEEGMQPWGKEVLWFKKKKSKILVGMKEAKNIDFENNINNV